MQKAPNPQLLGFFRSHRVAESSVNDDGYGGVDSKYFCGEFFAGNFWHGLIGDDGIKLVGISFERFLMLSPRCYKFSRYSPSVQGNAVPSWTRILRRRQKEYGLAARGIEDGHCCWKWQLECNRYRVGRCERWFLSPSWLSTVIVP